MRLLILSALLTAGCAISPLETMQLEIQNCVVMGGHPRLGPDHTVRCLP